MFNLRKSLILIILLVISLGVVSATDLSEDNIRDTQLSSQTTDEMTLTTDNSIKEINKKSDTKTKTNTNSTSYITGNSTQTSTNSHKTIIFNSTTFDTYVTNKMLNDNVNEGDTLDFQGIIYGDRFKLTINKPVNITSTTNDSLFGDDREIGFTINQNASGTNLTNIHFYNTHLVLFNASNVNINNITVEVQKMLVGSGQGVTSIREGSSNVNVTNSLFFTNSSLGVSTLVCAGASNVLIDNNTVVAKGYCGNLVYFTTYNLQTDSQTNTNITLSNNFINGTEAWSQSICVPLVIQGSNHKIINNTIRHNTTGINWVVMAQMVMNDDGEMVHDENDEHGLIFKGNDIVGNATLSSAFVDSNKFESLSVTNSQVTSNIVNELTVSNNCIVTDNSAKILRVTGSNSNVTNNKYAQLITNKSDIANRNIKWVMIDNTNINNYTQNNNLNLNTLNTEENTNILIDSLNLKTIQINNLKNTTLRIVSSNITSIQINNSNINIINSDLSGTLLLIKNNSTLKTYNTTILNTYKTQDSTYNAVNTTIIADKENYYILSNNNETELNIKSYKDYFDENTHILLNTIPEKSTIIIRNINEEENNQEMIINKALNIKGINNDTWNGEITFINGSQTSNLTSMTLNNNININTNNIQITNNTITKTINIKNSKNNTIQNNNITSNETPITLTNTQYTLIEKNNIITTKENTIQLDANSQQNTIKENSLIAENTKSSNSIKTENTKNTIKNNSPKENTTINITINDKQKLNIPADINIQVTHNNQSVTNGEVIIFANGLQISRNNLTNGQLNTKILIGETGTINIRVFYLPEDLYIINKNTTKVQVTEINSTMNTTTIKSKIGENTIITTALTDEYNNKINKGNITLTISNYTETQEVTTGENTFTFNTLESYKGQTLTIYYTGTESISNKTYKITFNPEKGNSQIKITKETENDNTIIHANALTINNETINQGYIYFTYTNFSKLVPITNGEANITIPTPTEPLTITATFRNNPNYETSQSNITIKHEMKNSTLYLYNIDNSTSNVVISGKLLSEGKAINGAKLTLNINNKTYTITPGSSGYFSYTIKAEEGTNTVTVTYDGNKNYNPATTTTTFTSNTKQKATLYLYAIDNSTSTVKITGKLLGNTKAITGSKLTLNINNKEYTITPGSSGYFSYTVNADYGLNTVLVSFEGNNDYAPITAQSTFTSYAKKKTTLYLYSIDNSTSSVKITGKLLGDGKAISGSKLSLIVNGKEYTVTPGSSGYFSYTVNADNGVNSVSVSFAGNDDYAQTSAETSFTSYAKKKATLYLYSIDNSTSSVKITGKLLGDGKAISGSKLSLIVNGKEYVVTPGSSGYFSYTVNADNGVNSVSVSFAGNDDYAQTSVNTSFTSYAKKKATLYLYSIDNSTSSVKITGKLLGDGKAISGSKLSLIVNGKEYTVTPGSSGYFSYTVNADNGVNSVSVSFAGNDDYAQASVNTSFTSYAKKSTVLYAYNPNEISAGQTTTISGKLLTADKKALSGKTLTININSKQYTVTTNKDGYYSYKYQASTSGLYDVVINFAGDDEYSNNACKTVLNVN